MKKFPSVIIVLMIILSLCACAVEETQKVNLDGSHIDLNFIESFPFVPGSMDDAENWFHNNGYEIESVDEQNAEIIAIYHGNSSWKINVMRGYCYYRGFAATLWLTSEVTSDELGIIFSSVHNELKELYGEPTRVWADGKRYEFTDNDLSIELYLEEDWVELFIGYVQ